MKPKIIKIDDQGINEAAELVREGNLVAYPTDTVYGLGCDPYNPPAVRHLIEVKRRLKGSLPILADSLPTVIRVAVLDEFSEKFARRFWPGPLTLILHSKARFPPEVLTLGTIGIRIPGRNDTLRLVSKCGGLLVGTSANVSGEKSPRTAEEVAEQLGPNISLVLDGGPATLGRESTVIKVEDGKLIVVREGVVSKEMLFQE